MPLPSKPATPVPRFAIQVVLCCCACPHMLLLHRKVKEAMQCAALHPL